MKEVLIESGNYRVVCIKHKYYSSVYLQRKAWFIWHSDNRGLQIGVNVDKMKVAKALMTFAHEDDTIQKAMRLLAKR